jgi:hypothetical protein
MQGTQIFNPPDPPRDPLLIAQWFTGTIPHQAQTQFQLFAMLADLLYFPSGGTPTGIDPTTIITASASLPPGGFLSDYFDSSAAQGGHTTIADVLHAYVTSSPSSIHAKVLRASTIRSTDPAFATIDWGQTGHTCATLLSTVLSPLIRPVPTTMQPRFRVFRDQAVQCYNTSIHSINLRAMEDNRQVRIMDQIKIVRRNLRICQRAAMPPPPPPPSSTTTMSGLRRSRREASIDTVGRGRGARQRRMPTVDASDDDSESEVPPQQQHA